MNGAEEIASSFVVTGGDGTELLELGEKSFRSDGAPDTGACPRGAGSGGCGVKGSRSVCPRFPTAQSAAFARHRLGPPGRHPPGSSAARHRRRRGRGFGRGEVKPGRIAQSVHRGGDLRAQFTAATSDGLAYFRPLPEGAGTVRVSTNEGRIHPDPLVVRLFRPSAKHALPHPRLAPAREPEVHHAEIPETLGQVAPRDACPISVQHRFHKQAVVCGSDPHVPSTSRQQILDAVPWVVSQCVSLFHRSILRRLGSAQRG